MIVAGWEGWGVASKRKIRPFKKTAEQVLEIEIEIDKFK